MPAAAADAMPGTTITGRPVLTWLLCGVCVLVFLGFAGQPSPFQRSVSRLFLAQVWEGEYWGLLTSAVAHRDVLHVAFNVYWLWALGSVVELAVGPLRWAAFCTTAAIVSSGVELGVAGSTGIGASGVVYALFGFSWVSRERYPIFRSIVTPQLVKLFLAWLVLCLVVTHLNIMIVGNAAHVGGLVFGAVVAALCFHRRRVWLMRIGLAGLLVPAVLPVFWCPWSPLWLQKQGYAAHARHDYAGAVQYYERSIQRGGDPLWALTNMALAYARVRDRSKYTETLTRLRKMDEEAAREIEAVAGPPESR